MTFLEEWYLSLISAPLPHTKCFDVCDWITHHGPSTDISIFSQDTQSCGIWLYCLIALTSQDNRKSLWCYLTLKNESVYLCKNMLQIQVCDLGSWPWGGDPAWGPYRCRDKCVQKPLGAPCFLSLLSECPSPSLGFFLLLFGRLHSCVSSWNEFPLVSRAAYCNQGHPRNMTFSICKSIQVFFFFWTFNL